MTLAPCPAGAPASSFSPRRAVRAAFTLRRAGRRLSRALAVVATAAVLTALGWGAAGPLSGPAPAYAQTAANGRVTGRILGLPEGMSPANAKVVLMRFQLNEQGVPEGKEVGSQTVGADGRYVFKSVPIVPRSLYRVVVQLGDHSFGSQGFPLTDQQPEVEVDAPFPHVVQDTSALRIDEALVAVEPRRGGVLVTQVAHVLNTGTDIVDGSRKPFEMTVPDGIEALEMVRGIDETGKFDHLGRRVLVYGNLPPGRTTVALRYYVPVWTGSVSMEPQFPYPVGVLSVLAPAGTLTVTGPGLSPQPSRDIQGTRYDIWSATDLAPRTPQALHVSGVPLRQQFLLVTVGIFAAVMVGVVVWFVRRRLPRQGAEA